MYLTYINSTIFYFF